MSSFYPACFSENDIFKIQVLFSNYSLLSVTLLVYIISKILPTAPYTPVRISDQWNSGILELTRQSSILIGHWLHSYAYWCERRSREDFRYTALVFFQLSHFFRRLDSKNLSQKIVNFNCLFSWRKNCRNSKKLKIYRHLLIKIYEPPYAS